MGLTFAEKILGARVGRPVRAGEKLLATPDRIVSHDDAAEVIRRHRAGRGKIWDPQRIVIALDLGVPASGEAAAGDHKLVREFVAAHGIEHFFDLQRGICHQVMAEEGLALPGGFIAGTDEASPIEGGLGALAVAISLDQASLAWTTGQIEIVVPGCVLLEVSGSFPAAVGAKDLMLHVMGAGWIRPGDARAVELTGETVRRLSIAGRMVLCSMMPSLGVSTGFVEADGVTLRFLARRARTGFEPVASDPDADFEQIVRVEVSELGPQVARPGGGVGSVVEVGEVAGTELEQAVLGTCSGGRVEDLWVAARRLRGHHVHPRVRFLVAPASIEVYTEALRLGLLVDLAEAGAIILNPSCGPCVNARLGALAEGEVGISTGHASRRSGRGNQTYLASPDTVAASALAGQIADPRER
jgi:3-isopropylmalate/(R)-2-methylmalate dehydratase large subunit